MAVAFPKQYLVVIIIIEPSFGNLKQRGDTHSTDVIVVCATGTEDINQHQQMSSKTNSNTQ